MYLHQLDQVVKVHFLVNGKLAIAVFYVVVLHLVVGAQTQCVVPWIVGALSHQEETHLWWGEQALGLETGYFAMKPSAMTTAQVPLFYSHSTRTYLYIAML